MMQTLKFLAAAFVATSMAGAAYAGTITQTGDVADQKTDYNNVGFAVTGGASSSSFAGFNAALGTLTSVLVSYTVDGTETGSLTNNSVSAQTFNFSSNSNLSVTDAGTSSPAALLNFLSSGLTLSEAISRYTLAAGASTSILPQPNGFGTGTLSENTVFTDATSLNQFIGNTFALDLNTLSGSTFAGGGGNITTALNTAEGGRLSIVYNYTPLVVSVPEPAAIAAFGAGLLGLTFLRLRKRA